MNGFFSWIQNISRKRKFYKKERLIAKHLSTNKFRELEKVIYCKINEKSYFIQALTHRSFLEEQNDYENSNERLEFLGDSVLNLIVAEFLFENFQEKDEGFLTKIRAKLVNRNALADAAVSIDLAKFMLVSKNVSMSYSNGSKTILSDAFEALIGAIYLDNGLDSARNFIEKTILEPNIKEGDYLIDENYKSQLLEFAQARKLENPTYEVIKEEGPQHARIFTVKVQIGENDYGIGKGKNKKTAEQNAAKIALKKIQAEID